MSARSKLAAIDAKIAKLQAEREPLLAAAAAEIDPEAVQVGDTVTVEYGRGESKTERTGKVLGVKREAGKGTVVKLLVGEGVDAEIIAPYSTAIKAIVKAEPVAEEGTPA